MNARIVAILVVLLVDPRRRGAALPAPGSAPPPRQRRDALGRPLFKDLKAADIASIRIVEPKATLTLRAQGRALGHRRARRTFRPISARCASSCCKALGLKVGQSEPIGEKDRARLNLDDSGTQVEFGGADGKPLGDAASSARSTSSARSRTPTRRSPTGASSRCPASRRPSTSSATR